MAEIEEPKSKDFFNPPDHSQEQFKTPEQETSEEAQEQTSAEVEHTQIENPDTPTEQTESLTSTEQTTPEQILSEENSQNFSEILSESKKQANLLDQINYKTITEGVNMSNLEDEMDSVLEASDPTKTNN